MSDNAFERLRRLLKRELRHLKRFGHSPRYDTSDVVQEACLQICRDYSENEVEDFPSNLLKKIVFGHLAKQNRFHNSAKRSAKNEERTADEAYSNLEDPQKTAEVNELTGLIFRSIERLDPAAREVVQMRLLYDATFSSIAAQLGMTVPVVKRLFNNAFVKIKAECQ